MFGKNADSVSPITLHIAQLAAKIAALAMIYRNGKSVPRKKPKGSASVFWSTTQNGIKQDITPAKISIPVNTVINEEIKVIITFETAYFTVPQRVIYIFDAELFHSTEKFAANGSAPKIAITFLKVSKQSKRSNCPQTFRVVKYDVKRVKQTAATPRIAIGNIADFDSL